LQPADPRPPDPRPPDPRTRARRTRFPAAVRRAHKNWPGRTNEPNVTDIVASEQRDPDASNDEATAGIAAAGPTPAITATHDQGPLPRDPGALALWLLAIAFAGIALLGLAALASRNQRPQMRR
jgi:hypothetical protein